MNEPSPACARSHFPAGLYPLAVRCILAARRAGPAVLLFADVLFAAGAGGVVAQLGGRVGARARRSARRGGRCFLTPPKFQGRNPTIPTDPRLDSGWATGPSICLPNGPAQTGRATAARSIATSAISTPIAGNRCRQTVTFAANRVRGRTPHPRARHDHVACGVGGDGGREVCWASIVELSAKFRLGRLAIAARHWQRSFFAADGGGVDCTGPRPSLGRSRSRPIGASR